MRRSSLALLFALALAAAAGALAAAPALFDNPPVLRASAYELTASGKPIRGICVWWHLDSPKAADEKKIRAEMARIRRLGFIGIGLEVGWSAVCPASGAFRPELSGMDRVIQWARAEGLWVHLLLTPHYMPDWVAKKHGDIRMRDENGQPADGSFMPYSPYSPAVDDLKDFQSKAAKHFSRHNNLLALWVTNEQGFGAKWLDYSKWGAAAWQNWLRKINPDISFWNARWNLSLSSINDAPVPKPGTEGQMWQDWLRFRRLSLRDYFNSLYDNAARARSRLVPIGHKIAIYNTLDAFARQWAVQPSPAASRMDVLGCDAYGSDAAMLSLARSFGKPVIMAETNFTSTPTGPSGRSEMSKMLLRQQLSGAFIQTLYAWNDFDQATFPWGLKDKDGQLRGGAWGASDVARMIGSYQMSAPALDAAVAVVVPAQAFAANSDDYASFQHRLSAITGHVGGLGIPTHLLFSDDIAPSAYLGGSSPSAKLDRYRVLVVLNDFGLDTGFFESDALKNWVEQGGYLLMTSRTSGPPAWTGIASSTVTGTQYVSGAGSATEWSLNHRPVTSPSALRLTGASGAEVTVLATLDSTGEPAALRRRLGKGHVVYTGIDVLKEDLFGIDVKLIYDSFFETALAARVSPPGAALYQLPTVAYLESSADWQGDVSLGARVRSLKVYHNRGGAVPNPPLKLQDATTLSGFLPGGWYGIAGTGSQ